MHAPQTWAAPVAPREQKRALWPYLRDARRSSLFTAPVVYLGIFPFALLDLFMTIYQRVCFPHYGIPLVKRTHHFLFDRGKLRYLNALERVNCLYCSYANGVCSFVTEIAARTEQHWCPIRHSANVEKAHSRYHHFLDYGDARSYHQSVEQVRRDFADIA